MIKSIETIGKQLAGEFGIVQEATILKEFEDGSKMVSYTIGDKDFPKNLRLKIYYYIVISKNGGLSSFSNNGCYKGISNIKKYCGKRFG